MNFDYIEGLTEEEISKFYDDDLIAGTGTKYEIVCDSGKIGYFTAITNDSHMPVGFYSYECGNAYTQGAYHVCGSGRCGTYRLIAHFDDTKPLTVWQLNCNNGKSGYFVAITDDSSSPVGFYSYECGNAYTQGAYHVCGQGECGYYRLITH